MLSFKIFRMRSFKPSNWREPATFGLRESVFTPRGALIQELYIPYNMIFNILNMHIQPGKDMENGLKKRFIKVKHMRVGEINLLCKIFKYYRIRKQRKLKSLTGGITPNLVDKY